MGRYYESYMFTHTHINIYIWLLVGDNVVLQSYLYIYTLLLSKIFQTLLVITKALMMM